MLASLLPGLREIRTPLTVGYMYLLLAWLWFADRIPRQKPAADGLLARLFELGDVLGAATAIAIVPFLAYMLGTLLTISTEGGLLRRAFSGQWTWHVEPTSPRPRRLGAGTAARIAPPRRLITDAAARQADVQLTRLFNESVQRTMGGWSTISSEVSWRLQAIRAANATPADLRVRLLVANQGLYGEYDRLNAEAEFRLNLCPPLVALGWTAAVQVDWRWSVATVVVVALLLYRGVVRLHEAGSVLTRSVLTRVIKHPLQTFVEEGGPTASPDVRDPGALPGIVRVRARRSVIGPAARRVAGRAAVTPRSGSE